MSSSELDVLQAAFREAGGRWSTFIIWAKDRFTLGRADYQRQYEPILYGWAEGAQRHWCGDRDQGDVWLIKKPARNDLPPTMKPVELVERAIRNPSRPGEVVLDAFGGSGTTLIAAEKAARAARLIELDPKYVDVIVRRRQDWTGELAYREPDGALLEGARADRLAISGEPLTMGYALRGLYLLRACKPCSARMEFSVGSPV
ncbi:site-specific DNA-methyltransferase (plasmid) [Ralstonia solanacearum]|nr:site-specific DNA-methyltransferase [Ralstonia solanacearum]